MVTSKIYEPDQIENYRDLINRTVEKYPNNIAYKYKKDINSEKIEYIEKTYKEFNDDITSFGTALLKLGLENKKVALISNNRYEWCVSYFAITIGNMVVVPLDKSLQEKEIENLIKRSGAEAVIYENKYAEIFKNIKERNQSNLKYYINFDIKENSENEIAYPILKAQGETEVKNGNTEHQNKKIDSYKMSIMLFTSGTTSEPKAVMLSQNNICSDIMGIACHFILYPTDVLLSFLPLHHTFESTITIMYGMYYGVTVAFCDGLKYIAKNIEEYKVSILVAVPLVLETLYKKIKQGLYTPGKQLREFLFGSAPMDKNVIEGYNEMGITTIQGYGLTETSPVISTETDKLKRPGSVGQVLPNLQVKIENTNKDGIGEILVKGPSVMIGYYQNQEETEKVLKNGWFNTGDLGYIDEDGFLYVTGRKKDVIVLKNGENVYPAELEILINKLPYVLESVVYSHTEERKISAKIVYSQELITKEYGEKTEQEIKNIIWEEIKKINQDLPIFKHIKEIHITTKPFEKTTTQKIKRYQAIND